MTLSSPSLSLSLSLNSMHKYQVYNSVFLISQLSGKKTETTVRYRTVETADRQTPAICSEQASQQSTPSWVTRQQMPKLWTIKSMFGARRAPWGHSVRGAARWVVPRRSLRTARIGEGLHRSGARRVLRGRPVSVVSVSISVCCWRGVVPPAGLSGVVPGSPYSEGGTCHCLHAHLRSDGRRGHPAMWVPEGRYLHRRPPSLRCFDAQADG